MDLSREALLGDIPGTGPGFAVERALTYTIFAGMITVFGSQIETLQRLEVGWSRLVFSRSLDCYKRRTALKPRMLEQPGLLMDDPTGDVVSLR